MKLYVDFKLELLRCDLVDAWHDQMADIPMRVLRLERHTKLIK